MAKSNCYEPRLSFDFAQDEPFGTRARDFSRRSIPAPAIAAAGVG